MGVSIRPEINFKKLFKKTNFKQKIWNNLIEKTQNETGEEVPDWIKNIVTESLKKYESMRNERQFYSYLLNKIKEAQCIFKKFLAHSIQLDPNCKVFINKIIDECYLKKDSKGIKRRLWKYMNQIEVLAEETKCFGNIGKSKMDSKVAIHRFLTFYERVYEITIKFLSEYAYIIAESRINNSIDARKYVDLYEKLSKKGESIRRIQLQNFFDSIGFWTSANKCGVLNSKLRNSVSHFNFYSVNHKIKIKNNWVTIDELRAEYIQLISFYTYILGKSIKKTKWDDFSSNMEKQLQHILSKKRILRLIYNSVKKLGRKKDKFQF